MLPIFFGQRLGGLRLRHDMLATQIDDLLWLEIGCLLKAQDSSPNVNLLNRSGG